MKKILLIAGALILFASCSSVDIYEKTEAFRDHSWSGHDRLTFHFTINDTVSRYNIYVVIRHLDAYHWNNLWVNLTTIPPGDSAHTQQLNLRLGDNAKGWLGSAMEDIIEQRVLLNPVPMKLKSGDYTFILQQIMREDPLEYVMNAGIRVEKVIQ